VYHALIAKLNYTRAFPPDIPIPPDIGVKARQGVETGPFLLPMINLDSGTYVYIYVYMFKSINIYINICMYIYKCICIYINMHVYIQTQHQKRAHI
jgi:hypothetical protein